MNDILARTLEAIEIGGAKNCDRLTMCALLGGKAGDPDYRTLDEALAAGAAKVTEVSPSGSVPSLRFQNGGEFAVLLVDGEELIGAKQNRVLNLTILAPARQEILIPVSCVEAGRWSHVSEEFRAAPRTHYAAGRAGKAAQVSYCLERSGDALSDQGEVWADISAKARRMHARSETDAMAALFEGHSAAIERYVQSLTPEEGQTGALFAIDDRVVGVDLFDYQATLTRMLPKLVRSYALDALDPGTPAAAGGELTARAFLTRIAAAEAPAYQAVGEGEDLRLEGPGLAGGALVARNRLVHLGVFSVQTAGRTFHTRMSRPSTRSAH